MNNSNKQDPISYDQGALIMGKKQTRKWKALNKGVKSDAFYERWIDNTDMKAKLKNLLKKILKKTQQLGPYIYKIGKFILDALIKVCQQFPHAAAGAAIGFALGLFIQSVPWVGWFIGPFAIPILTILGGASGGCFDMISTFQRDSIIRIQAVASESL